MLGALRCGALAVAMAIPLSGCVVIPLPQGEGEVTEGREVPEARSTIIEPGRVMRTALLAHLGEPQAIWDERHIVIYAWDRVHLKLLWILAGGMRAAAGVIDVPTHYMLLVQFDEKGMVSRAERCVRPAMASYGAFLREWADGKRCT